MNKIFICFKGSQARHRDNSFSLKKTIAIALGIRLKTFMIFRIRVVSCKSENAKILPVPKICRFITAAYTGTADNKVFNTLKE